MNILFVEFLGKISMNSLITSGRKQKLNLLVPEELAQKAVKTAGALNYSLSDFLRIAVHEYIERYERGKQEREIAEAFKVYGAADASITREWSSAEQDGWPE